MKNLYETAVKKRAVFFTFFIALMYLSSFAQESVIWNVIPNANSSITGSFSGFGSVNVLSEGTGTPITFTNWDNTTFEGTGGYGNAPSQKLTFYFNTPVIITTFRVQDVNYNGDFWNVNNWNDSFTMSNILFKSFSSLNAAAGNAGCCVSLTGVNMPTDVIFPSDCYWFKSDTVNSFTLNFTTSPIGLTTAVLYYSIDLIRLPVIGPLCINSTPPTLPTSIGGGTPVSGTWSPATINTSVAGNFTYTFTPNAGQVINYPVPITVTILPYGPSCCTPTLTLVAPTDNVTNLTLPTTARHREASDWIKATNIVGVGDNVYQNLVVYNAGNYVELNPGFEAVLGSQFLVFQGPCNSNITTPPSRPAAENIPMNVAKKEIIGDFGVVTPASNELMITPNPSSKTIGISMKDTRFNKVTITTLDGKKVYERNIESIDKFQVDISSYVKGIYIVNVTSTYGQTFTKKLIKN